MELGVGFLQDEHPEVVGHAAGEYGLSLRIAREEVIHRHHLPFAVLADFDPVKSELIHMAGYE